MTFYRISIPVYSYILICSSSFVWHLVLWNRLTWDSVMWRSMSLCYFSSRVNMIVLYDILCYIVLCDHVTCSSYMNSCQHDRVMISYVTSCCVIMLRDRLTRIHVNVIVLYEILCYIVLCDCYVIVLHEFLSTWSCYDILCYIVLCDYVTWSSYTNSCQRDRVIWDHLMLSCYVISDRVSSLLYRRRSKRVSV